MRFVKIISGSFTDKWLTKCGADAQSHIGCLILIKTRYNDPRYLKSYNLLINHESIHIAQARELLIIFWYLAYVINFLVFFIPNFIISLFKRETYNDFIKSTQVIFWNSYRKIIFEIEAYENDEDLNYLKKRKIFNCFRKKN